MAAETLSGNNLDNPGTKDPGAEHTESQSEQADVDKRFNDIVSGLGERAAGPFDDTAFDRLAIAEPEDVGTKPGDIVAARTTKGTLVATKRGNQVSSDPDAVPD